MVPLSKLKTVRGIRLTFSSWYISVILLMHASYLHVLRPITWHSRSGALVVPAARVEGDLRGHPRETRRAFVAR